MQLFIYNRYDSHYVYLLPSQLLWTRFVYLSIPKSYVDLTVHIYDALSYSL